MNGCKHAILCGLLGLGMVPGPVPAHNATALAAPSVEPAQGRVRFAEVTLLDQHGRSLSLKDDVVADRVVVMGFVYTSCTTVCPLVSAIMQQLQQRLADRPAEPVRLVTLSVDPQRDTPARLHEYAQRYGAGGEWYWLTGTVPAVDSTLKGLGSWSADYRDHPPLILVGDGRSEHWTRFYGVTDPAVLAARVDALLADRSRQAVTGGDNP